MSFSICFRCFIVYTCVDFSRRRQRRTSTPRSKGPTSKGFVPKPQLSASTQKKEKQEDKDGINSQSAVDTGSNKKIVEGMNVAEIVPVVVNNSSALLSKKSCDSVDVENKSIKPKSQLLESDYDVSFAETESEDASLQLNLVMDARLRKDTIEILAQEHFSRGSKFFVYPPVVKPNVELELFLNRSLSTLNNEPTVMIMGAFNDWRWKSFTKNLIKTNLNGDWWSCIVHVPSEAFKMDFVFFNGKDIYDNNDNKDFCIFVEGGITENAFEDFLLEEKRRELERLAKEQAERERQAEEQRQKEEEKAGMEADRAQAKADVDKMREAVHLVLQKAVFSLDNVWRIEPRLFKWGERIRLYYKKNSGPLINATEIWIHGGYNGWQNGLSIVGKLFRDPMDDWWYAEGMKSKSYLVCIVQVAYKILYSYLSCHLSVINESLLLDS